MSILRSPRLFALAALAFLAAPSPADACGNSVERVVDLTNQQIRHAETLLAEARYQDAAKQVLETFPKALRLDQNDRKQGLFERGQRVLAIAIVRSQGAIKVGAALPGKTAAERETSLAWAASILRYHQAAGLGSIGLGVDLAEALSLRPTEASEAYAILKDLGDRDLMPGPRGWALLGELEKARGDAAAASQAVKRCQEIATDAKQCDVVKNS